MSTQGQGDVASRANIMADMMTAGDRIRYGDDAALLRELAAEIARLRALLSSSRGEQGWRTIDSAPKDGTYIILGNAQGAWVGCYVARYQSGYVPEEPWHSMMMNRRHMPRYSSAEPTHWMPLPSAPGSVPTSLAGQGTDDAKEDAAAAYFRSAIADGQAAVLLADLATYDNVLRELGIQESHKHPVDEVRRIQRVAETAHDQGVETAAKLIDRKVSDYTSEHGSLDPETGAMEFSLSGEEYVSTLEELAEEIRAINAAAPQPTAGGDADV